MGNWSDATLSTASSIAKFESEINELTSSDWSDKISVAKEVIGDKLEIYLKRKHYDDYIDFSSDEDIKDIISNPTVFNISSDYYVLFLIYDDLAHGKGESAYYTKRNDYLKLFRDKLENDMQRVEISYDLDSEAEEYMQDIRPSRQVTR